MSRRWRNMMRLVEDRERGGAKPTRLSHLTQYWRSLGLELSKNIDTQSAHSSGINTMDIDPVDSSFLLSGGANGMIAIHNIERWPLGGAVHRCDTECTISPGQTHGHNKSVETVQWYPHDNQIFVTSSTDAMMKVWDANLLKPADVFKLNDLIYCHHMSPIGTKHSLIAVATKSSYVKLCDMKSGSSSHVLKGHTSEVLTVRWSTRNQFLLATGSRDNTLLLWDVRRSSGFLMSLDQHNADVMTSKQQTNTAHNGAVNSLMFTDDGLHLLSSGTDNRLRLWDTFTGRNSLVNYGPVPNSSRKGSKMCMTRNNIGSDFVFVPSESDVVMYDIFEGRKRRSLKGHYNTVNCCTYAPLTQCLFSGGADYNILVWTADNETADRYRDETETKSSSQRSAVSQANTNQLYQDTWSDDES